LITGADADGRSYVVEEAEVAPVDPGGDHGVSVARVYATAECPPAARLPGRGVPVGVELAPGLLKWMVVDHQPHEVHAGPLTSTTMHYKDTLDLVLVQEGSADLVLDDGAHPVVAGDLVVMPGVDHAWKAGPDGCRVVVVSVGTPPPEG
jgi:hypothetical protein